MSGRKKRQAALQEQAEVKKRAQRAARLRLWLTVGVLGLSAIISVCLVAKLSRKEAAPVAAIDRPAPSTCPTLQEILTMRPDELAKVDIALVNLRCAEGLRGAENLNIETELSKLDQWAERVKSETERHFYKFRQRPEDFKKSEPYFRMLVLATVLQEDFNIHYDPSLKVGFPPPEDDRFFEDSRNVFIHGVTERQMGSCSSLPVVYVAVGRRLGYPLKLVPANSHLYLRWEDSRTRLNVEATTEGFVSHPDEEYWHWPQPVTSRQAEKFEFFKNFSPQDELACFLSARGEVLMANDDYEGALKYHELAEKASPHSEMYRLILSHVRPYVRYRREFAEKRRDKENLEAVQSALAEQAYLRAMNGRNAADSPMAPIPRDPVPGAISPTGIQFTPPGQQPRNIQTQPPYGQKIPARVVPSTSPRPH